MKKWIWGKKIYKKSTEFKFLLPLLCGMEPTLKCGSFTHWNFIGESWVFFHKQLSTGKSFLVCDRFHPFRAGTLSSLNVYSPCAWGQTSFWVQTCFSPVVSERHSFLGVFTPYDSYNIYASSSVGFSDCSKKKLLKPSNENWVSQSISLSVHCPASSWWEKFC